MSIALDLDVGLKDFDQIIKDILNGLYSYKARLEEERFSEKILENSNNRIETLEKYLKI